MKVCPNPTCNFANLPDDSAFCTECGTPIGAPQQAPPPPPEPQQAPPPPPEPQQAPPPPSGPTLELPNNTTFGK